MGESGGQLRAYRCPNGFRIYCQKVACGKLLLKLPKPTTKMNLNSFVVSAVVICLGLYVQSRLTEKASWPCLSRPSRKMARIPKTRC